MLKYISVGNLNYPDQDICLASVGSAQSAYGFEKQQSASESANPYGQYIQLNLIQQLTDIMNKSSQILQRYLHNFDPMNQSAYKPQTYDSDSSYDLVNTDKYQSNDPFQVHQFNKAPIVTQPVSHVNRPSLASDASHNEQSKLKSRIRELEFEIKQRVKNEDDLRSQLIEQKDKIHALADHISALEFENQQMASVINKNSKITKMYKSMKTETLKIKNNENNRINEVAQKLKHIFDVLESFIQSFSALYLKNERNKDFMCANFENLLLEGTQRGFSQSNDPIDNISKISSWLVNLFEQIQFSNRLLYQFRDQRQGEINEKTRMLQTYRDQSDIRISQLTKQNSQLKIQLQKVRVDNFASSNPEIEPSNLTQVFMKIGQLLKLICVDNNESKQYIEQYLQTLKHKYQAANTMLNIEKNLKMFERAKTNNEFSNLKLYNNELKFKKNLMDKQKQDIKQWEFKLQNLLRLVSQSTNKENRRSQNYQNLNQIMSQQLYNNNTFTQRYAADKPNRLFEQVTAKNENELVRQSSLLNLKKKIQNAQTLSRIMSKKNIKLM